MGCHFQNKHCSLSLIRNYIESLKLFFLNYATNCDQKILTVHRNKKRRRNRNTKIIIKTKNHMIDYQIIHLFYREDHENA